MTSVLRKCFSKNIIVPGKQLYNKEISELLRSSGLAKKELSRQSIIKGKQKHLSHRIKKLDKLIDVKISDFNSQVIMDKTDFDGTISKQDFWKIKRKIGQKVLTSYTH